MLLDESGGQGVAEAIRGAERVVASRLVRVEAERALLRVRLEAPEAERVMPDLSRSLRDMWARVDMMEVTEAVCREASRIAPASRLRILDVIHLATFHEFRRVDPSLQMLTFDAPLQREL
jgi:predicted nucleic acid-binding protein